MDASLEEFLSELQQHTPEAPKTVAARPFLKWVGGKAKLIPFLLDLFPKKVHRYYEPFIGGGAVFWSMSEANRFETATLNDWNAELVNTYKVLRDFPEELLKNLAHFAEIYPEAPLSIYNTWRDLTSLQSVATLSPIDMAARFIFLNKAGFNGMFRLNQKGKFNVPWGQNPKVQIYQEPVIRACSAALNKFVNIIQGDFVDACKDASEGDLVYLDPPYVPISETSNFTGYTEKGFSLDDQYRAAALFKDLASRGVAVVLSNSDTPEVRGMFEGFEMHVVPMRRNINSKASGRGPVNELVVVSRQAPRKLGDDYLRLRASQTRVTGMLPVLLMCVAEMFS